MDTERHEVSRYLINPEPGFKVCIPIVEDADIYSLLNNSESALFEDLRVYVRDFVMDRAKLEIGRIPQGVFRYPEEIDRALFARCDSIVHTRIDGKMMYVVKESDGHHTYEHITLPEDIYELGRSDCVSAIDIGATILLRLEEFLQRGVWQVGFRCGKSFLTDVSSFPYRIENEDGTTVWQNDAGVVCEPILWFGLPDEEPEEEWSLSAGMTSDWRSFWFNHFWHLDWNALFGGFDNYYTVWMFCECGMDEPEEDFDRVKDSCPISLDENDTDEQLFSKINEFFNSIYKEGRWIIDCNSLTDSEFEKKRESLREALKKAGYSIGEMYMEGHEDNEDAVRLPDGRLDPDWIDDGFGDQLMESMNDLEDFLELDEVLFPGNYERDVNQGTMPIWNDLLDLYLDYDEVEECLCLGWEQLLKELYKDNDKN